MRIVSYAVYSRTYIIAGKSEMEMFKITACVFNIIAE